MVQDNLLQIDILKDDVQSFVEFLQVEFKCDVSVSQLFGSKFELLNHVKPEVKTPSITSSSGELNYDQSDEELDDNRDELIEKDQDHAPKHISIKSKCDVSDQKTEQKKIKLSDSPQVKTEFRCDECDKYFERREGLTKHINLRHGDGNFETYDCKLCDYKSKYVKRLENHINEYHSEDSSGKLSKPKKSTMCPECGKVLKTVKILNKHIREVHTGEEMFCDQCDYKTKRRRCLKVHTERFHSENGTVNGRETLTCEICGFQTKWKQTLEDHTEREHIKVSYPCNMCDFVASTKRKLSEHKNRHGQILKCTFEGCEKVFETSKKWLKHIRERHKPKIYIHCKICDYSSSSKKFFAKHMKSKHGIIEQE